MNSFKATACIVGGLLFMLSGCRTADISDQIRSVQQDYPATRLIVTPAPATAMPVSPPTPPPTSSLSPTRVKPMPIPTPNGALYTYYTVVVGDMLSEVDFEQSLNAQVPLDLTFRDERSNLAPLHRYINEKPVVLVFAYYECPNLCSLVLEEVTNNLRALSLKVGDQFNVITVSFTQSNCNFCCDARTAPNVYRYPNSNSDSDLYPYPDCHLHPHSGSPTGYLRSTLYRKSAPTSG